MKPDLVEKEFQELAWRRPLSEAEQLRLREWLTRHPERRAEWEADAALSAALARLPQRSAPSNLVARTLAAIDREHSATAGGQRAGWFGWLGSLGWVPRIAVAVGILGGGVFWYQHHQRVQEQTKALATLASVTEAGGMPSPEALENFEVILRIHPALQADTELISMSKELADFNKP